MTLKHRFVSTKPDTLDPTKLGPDDWGSSSTDYAVAPTHVFSGGSDGDVIVRDSQSSDGTSWRDIGAAGVVAAICDGITDNVGVIQAAINVALANGGGRIVIPSGLCAIGSGLIVGSNIRLSGSGSGTTLLMASGANIVTMIKVPALTNGVQTVDVIIDGLIVDGNRAHNSGSGQNYGILLENVGGAGPARVTLRDVLVQNLKGLSPGPAVAIAVAKGTDVLIDGCRVRNVGTVGAGASDAIYTSGVRNRIVNCYIEAASDTAIVVESSTDCVIANNVITDTPVGIAVDGAIIGTAGIGCTITGNLITNFNNTTQSGIYVFRDSGPSNSIISITGNTVRSGTNGHGIMVVDSASVVISGNVVDTISTANGKHGILVITSTGATARADGIVVVGNHVTNCGGEGISLQGVKNFIVSQNIVTGNSQTSASAESGIGVVDSASGAICSRGSILGNRSSGAAQSRGLLLSGGADKIFIASNDFRFNANNPGYSNTASGEVRRGFNLTNSTVNSSELIDYLSVTALTAVGDLTLSRHIARAGGVSDDIAGQVQITNGNTTGTHSFATPYTNAPLVLLTCAQDPAVRFWATSTVNDLSANMSAASVGTTTFNYLVFGAPN